MMIKTYPIYFIYASYIQDDIFINEDERWYKSLREGLPKGRIRGYTSWHNRMFRKKPDIRILHKEYEQNFYNSLNNSEKYPIINPSDLVITIQLKHYEEWCLTWFSHFTFDNGQSDDEILDNFQRYVCRTEERNRSEGCFKYSDDGSAYWSEPYCLMGAEDRWRWRSATPDGSNNENPDKYPPPCRCDGCKERGVITINH